MLYYYTVCVSSFRAVLCTAFSNQLIISGLHYCSTLAELSCQSPEEFGSAGCVGPSGPSRDGSLPKQSNLWRQQSGGVPIKSISGRSNSRMWHQDVTSWAELAAGPALVYCSGFTRAHNWKNSCCCSYTRCLVEKGSVCKKKSRKLQRSSNRLFASILNNVWCPEI